jgi:hypothetical protein
MAKKKVLTEKQVDEAYEVVCGFNALGLEGDENPNGRGNVGDIVFRKDFSDAEWSQIHDCLVKVEEPLKEDEVVIFEKIEGE